MHFKAMCLGMFGSAQIVGVAGVPGGLWGHYFLEALFAGLLVQLRLALSCLTFLTSEGWGCPHKIRPNILRYIVLGMHQTLNSKSW